MKIWLFIALLVFCSTPSPGQNIEEDLTVTYMKANVLYNSGRFDEAVRMYNRILASDENHSMALLMRAKAKYHLGAFKGTKIDALTFIDQNGVTKDIIHLMARTEFKMSNFKAANGYILTALELDEYDGELYYMAGEISLSVDQKNDACERFEKGAVLGHPRSIEKLAAECQGRVLSMSETRDESFPIQNNGKSEMNQLDSTIISESGDSLKTIAADVPDISPSLPPADLSASQDVVIDSKLTLQITNGLGDRKLESNPNIFMLSTEDGHVVVDICVDMDGKVISTEFNRGQSSINRSSLTSLAIRKSREFVFLPSLRSEQCGSIIFYIKS